MTYKCPRCIERGQTWSGERSWRYAAVVDNGIIEKLFEEAGRCDNAATDPYEETTPEKVLEYVKTTVKEPTLV